MSAENLSNVPQDSVRETPVSKGLILNEKKVPSNGTIFKLPCHRGAGHELLAQEYSERFSLNEGKRVITMQTVEPGFTLTQTDEQVVIVYDKLPSLHRGYGQLLANPDVVEIAQKPALDTIGLHIDSSRGAEYEPEFLKKTMLQLALMGFNSATLYTEYFDVEGHPNIKQNQLSKDETKSVANFARNEFGIEMYPSMQTLGHLEKVLKHEEYTPLALDRRTLNPNNHDIYAFIDDLIKNASEPYTSNRINIGCDETPTIPDETYVKHLEKINEICKQQGKQPIIWGDILIENLMPDEFAKVPKDMHVNYWQYESEDKDFHRKSLAHLQKHGFTVIVSPGSHSWDRFYPLLPKAFANIDAVLLAAKEENVKEAVLTIWGDNGSESALRPNLPALVRFAEHGWNKTIDEEEVKKSVTAIGHNSYDDFLLPVMLDLSPVVNMDKAPKMTKKLIKEGANPTSDIFFAPSYYDSVHRKLIDANERAHSDNKKLFTFAVALADVLRGEIRGSQMNETYDAMRDAHFELWKEERKPEGFKAIAQKYEKLQSSDKGNRWKGDLY